MTASQFHRPVPPLPPPVWITKIELAGNFEQGKRRLLRNQMQYLESLFLKTNKKFTLNIATINPVNLKRCKSKNMIIVTTAHKMKFFITYFFSKCEQSIRNCGFGPIYRRNPKWKRSFLVQCPVSFWVCPSPFPLTYGCYHTA